MCVFSSFLWQHSSVSLVVRTTLFAGSKSIFALINKSFLKSPIFLHSEQLLFMDSLLSLL